jgi:2'-5' RNA ligase
MKKLFFAFWPDDTIRQQCSNVLGTITGNCSPVALKNIHATVLFLGRINVEQQAAIAEAVATLPIPGVRLCFDRLSFWKKPGILCLTCRHFDQEVVTLSEQLAAIAKQYAVTVDESPFKPHITLARKAKRAVEVEFEPIIWKIQAFCLVESCSLADGIEYRVLQRWPEI